MSLGLLAACSGSVNEELIATPTMYPLRTPVVAGNNTNLMPPSTPAVIVATEDIDIAIDALNAAIARGPERADLYLQRAALWERLPDFVAAEEDFSRAIAIDPGSAVAYAGRGGVRATTAEGDLARYQAAMDDFNRALAIDPRSLPAQLGRVLVYAERSEFRGDPQDLTLAHEAITAIAEQRSEPLVLAMQARVLAAQGRSDLAEQVVADALAGLPPDPPAADLALVETTRAAVALTASDWATAVEAAEAALRSDPSRWGAYRVLAAAELGRGETAAALAAADQLLAKLPNDGRARYWQGLALAAAGRVEEARKSLEAAAARLPHSPVYQAKVVEALQRL